MMLIFPENIFAQLIEDNLPSNFKKSVTRKASSLISLEVMKDSSSVGLLPTMDLIKYKELFVSKSYGISFEGSLCNSYIYYNSGQKNITEMNLTGDISSIEVLLCKILFSELYDRSVEVKIATEEKSVVDKNYLLTGDKNFKTGKFLNGISFAEEIVDTLSLPFVNYVFASQDRSLIQQINQQLTGISNSIYDQIEELNFGNDFPETVKTYIRDNISSFVIDFKEQDLEGINQITRLPYYHGIINDIIEVKFV